MGGDELFSDTYPMKLVDNCMYEVYGKHISSISSKSDSGASISSNKGGSSNTIGRDNSSNRQLGQQQQQQQEQQQLQQRRFRELQQQLRVRPWCQQFHHVRCGK